VTAPPIPICASPVLCVVQRGGSARTRISALFDIHYGIVNVPEITRAVHKFDCYFSGPEIRSDVDHAAFAFFFSDGIHEEESLSGLDLRLQRQDTAMDADRVCFGNRAEETIVRGTSANTNRNGQLQTFAAPTTSQLLRHSVSYDYHGLNSLKLNLRLASGNSTFWWVIRALSHSPK
jgi:hypothetical protein